MTPERWKQIDDLVQAAIERPVRDRVIFLDQACAGDAEMRGEVESLIHYQEQAASFLQSTALKDAATLLVASDQVSRQGQVIGHYKLLDKLAAGGMGEVHLAEDVRLGRKVAVKFLLPDAVMDQTARRRFIREAQIAARLEHTNICAIYEVGEENEQCYIVMQYIEGETLASRLKHQPLALIEALEIALQMGEALGEAHACGIIHRDLKPQNVMLTPRGQVKVLDFGLAKVIRQRQAEESATESESLLSDIGIIAGTFPYMSPEQVKGEALDARSDIFSFGVVLYEMVSGQQPFKADSSAETIAAILDRQPLPLQLFAAVPSELEKVVAKALEKRREARYQSVNELLLDLKNLQLELELEAKLKHVTGERELATRPAEQSPLTESPTVSLLPPSLRPTSLEVLLEPLGGAVPLDSRFYIVRPTDEKFHAAITRQDSIVLVKGARQVGKTSLLARGLQQAREKDAKVVLTDFQNLSADDLELAEKLLLSLADSFADQLDLDISPNQIWKTERSPSVNFEQYLRRAVLAKVAAPVVWGLDEVDRLFTCDYASSIFGLFRSWHNKRALDPTGPWHRLTLAIAYATEAHLFITDLNQSPFNVGTRLQLEDLSFEQVEELNARYGSPLRDKAEIMRFFRLVSGHPYLVRQGLYQLVSEGSRLAELEAQADHDEGPFGDHLRRIVVSLTQDPALCAVVHDVLHGRPCPTPESFYRLRSAGLVLGDSARNVRLRCQLYTTYLEKHLL